MVLNIVEDFMRRINDAYIESIKNQKIDENAKANGFADILTSWKDGQDYFRLDGSTKGNDRYCMVQEFNNIENKKLRCFLISAKAGGQGINLTAANRCIILDTSWNPSTDQQSIFRIYRLGQDKTCYVYR